MPPPQTLGPKRPNKYANNDEVVDGILMLSVEGTNIRVGETTLGESISRLTSKSKPQKYFVVGWSQIFKAISTEPLIIAA